MKKLLFSFFVFLVFTPQVLAVGEKPPEIQYFHGEVLKIQNKEVNVKLLDGAKAGKIITVPWDENYTGNGQFVIKKSTKVILQCYQYENNKDNCFIVDKTRKGFLLFLAILLIGLIILISRKDGVRAIFGLIWTILTLVILFIPRIAAGTDPVIVTTVAVAIFVIPSLLISHGFNKKTYISIAGILISVVAVGILTKIAISFTGLTGINQEETMYLNVERDLINLLDLLTAGILIGTVGVLDDIVISQTSSVVELVKANSSLTVLAIFQRAMNIGRDHINAIINTLFLAYLSTSLPMMILIYQQKIPWQIALEREFIATEIIRILVSTIGLVIAVPLSTILAAKVFVKK